MAHELEMDSRPRRTAVALYVILWVVWAGLLLGPISFCGVLGIIFANRTEPLVELLPVLSIIWVSWLVVGIGGAGMGRRLLIGRMMKRRPEGFAGLFCDDADLVVHN